MKPLHLSQLVVFFLLILFLLQGPVWAERILMVAPHPDDEAVALGGWLYDQNRAGNQIWVVFLTDGEGFMRALRAKSKRPAFMFHYQDFQKLGRIRRNEAGKSLDKLGIGKTSRFFLGYPTGLLMHLRKMPKPEPLIRSRATGFCYGIGELEGKKTPPRPFSQASLFQDIDTVLKKVKPETLILPHPQDSNLDHQATTAMFVQRCKKLGLKPRMMGYFVHLGSRTNFPKPYGYHPAWGLESPGFMKNARHVFPTPEGIRAKEAALRCHKTQIDLRDGFLLSFIRKEELFWDLNSVFPSP